MLNKYLDVNPEVAEAIASGKPVVALESTNISHGMPYPQNVETALAVEKIIRENGLDDKTGREIYQEAGFSGRLDVSAVITKSQMEKTAQIPLSTLCFGDVGITFAPFEMFDTNCIQIRDASPFEFTMTVGYSNARHHYLPCAYSLVFVFNFLFMCFTKK